MNETPTYIPEVYTHVEERYTIVDRFVMPDDVAKYIISFDI